MKNLIILSLFLCYATAAYPQRLVKGQVLSAKDSLPLKGAAVMTRDSTVRVLTDDEGRFALTLANSPTNIIVSFVGYQTQVLTINGTNRLLTVRLMERNIQFSDVVVFSNGYQLLPKERSTGSFNVVGNKLFNEQVSTSILPRLEAVANGLSVDRRSTSPGIMIRGLSTIQGNRGPLIVLDNFPYEGNIDNINPNDVESITVLKDAAAASIWGAKAGNGVIVITTKKAKNDQPLTVSFNSNLTIGGRPDLGKAKQMGSADYIGVERMLFSRGGYDAQINAAARPSLSPVVEALLAARRGTITNSEAERQIAALQEQDIRNDLNHYAYRQAVNQQYALGLQGGANNFSWSTSASFDRNLGSLSERYDRVNLRQQASFRPFKNLELNTDLYYTHSTAITGRPAYGSSEYRNQPYISIADNLGEPVAVARDFSLSYLATLPQGRLLDWKYYPLRDWESDRTNTGIQDILANVSIRYRIIPGLHAEMRYQHERQTRETGGNHEADSYFTRNLVNRFSQLSSAGDVLRRIPAGAIYDRSNAILSSNNGRASITYDRTWGSHSINGIGGAEIRDSHTDNYQMRRYGVNPDVLSSASVDYLNSYPAYIGGSQGFIPMLDGFGRSTTRFVSVFANAAYTYQEKYTVSGSVRRDASNLFGVNINNKWTPLWSAGLAWDLSKEEFFDPSWLSVLKLRATYGYSGNTDPSRTGVTTVSFSTNSVYTGSPIARIERFGNPDLGWEQVSTANLGLDFATKGNRIQGSIEYYRKRGQDLFGNALLDYTGGAGASIVKNVASMSGHGIDLELKSINLKGAITWSTDLNFSTYHDKITTYNISSRQGSQFVGTSTGLSISGLEGKPVYSVFAYRWAGLDPQTGDPRGYLKGQVSKDYAALTGASTTIDDLTYVGPALPQIYGSLGNTVSWRSWSLDVRLLYRFDYYFKKPTISYTSLYNGGAGHSDYGSRWQKPGDEVFTNIPSAVYPAISSRDSFFGAAEPNILKGDNIRLQYITLSYSLDSRRLPWLPVKNAQLYMNVNNIGILWRANKDGIDPDFASPIPVPRTYAFGFRVNL
ncbi:SusC/RagA family TonB-linked outer membrane protein [Mucilaginibacter sp. PAMB04274]|uniref:SusC/RagA family TonB-linked outer membrane protein n=1 Tax=Mucilaginibacter sp. PAMB04274 TaxID=3138568 RepID=UPI0031F68A87